MAFYSYKLSLPYKWYFVSKIVLTFCEEKLFMGYRKTEGWEFAKILSSIEQFVQTVKD
jgi:hypothetical protein